MKIIILDLGSNLVRCLSCCLIHTDVPNSQRWDMLGWFPVYASYGMALLNALVCKWLQIYAACLIVFSHRNLGTSYVFIMAWASSTMVQFNPLSNTILRRRKRSSRLLFNSFLLAPLTEFNIKRFSSSIKSESLGMNALSFKMCDIIFNTLYSFTFWSQRLDYNISCCIIY